MGITFKALTDIAQLFFISVKQDNLSTTRSQQGTNSLPHSTCSTCYKYLFIFEIQKIFHFSNYYNV